ncbi:hypothetical protein [Macellibacteroides fermentans]|uniref:hypothetical protein n=1 Tax=Macellibacteroides fermentans TaxID=879969 RepID=UPI00406C2BD9
MSRFLLLLFLIIGPLNLSAQRLTEYNEKGNEALSRNDLADAKMWFEEGVSFCDSYSIDKLTTIWIENEQFRIPMRSLMTKCLNCLNIKATENDTASIARLILYYEHGIGTPESPELANYWEEQLSKLSKPEEQLPALEKRLPSPKEKPTPLNLIIGYNFTPSAPYGITFGLIGKRWGGYLRLKSNMIFGETIFDCNESGILNYTEGAYYKFDRERISRFGITGGLIVKILPWLSASVGVGYGERELQWHATAYSYSNNSLTTELWCENVTGSYKGIETDADAIVKVSKNFYFSVGCNSINLEFADLNAGIGLIF